MQNNHLNALSKAIDLIWDEIKELRELIENQNRVEPRPGVMMVDGHSGVSVYGSPQPKDLYEIIIERWADNQWQPGYETLDAQPFTIKYAKKYLKVLCVQILQGKNSTYKSAFLSEDEWMLAVSPESNKKCDDMANGNAKTFAFYKIRLIPDKEFLPEKFEEPFSEDSHNDR